MTRVARIKWHSYQTKMFNLEYLEVCKKKMKLINNHKYAMCILHIQM